VSTEQVSIIIPTAGRVTELRRLLTALLNQTYTNFEVIIVNKGPIDEITKVICVFKKKMKIKLLREDRGLVPQLNLGITNSSGSIIARIDDDAYPISTWIEELVKPFNTSSVTAGTTGPSLVPVEMIKNRDSLIFLRRMLASTKFVYTILRGLYLYILLEKKWQHPGLITQSGATTWGGAIGTYAITHKPMEVMFMCPANMAVKRDVLYEVGLFDENYKGIGTFSEPDLALQILRKGYKIFYNPKAIVYHLVSKSGIFPARFSTFNEGYNLLRFISKNILPMYGIRCVLRVLLHILLVNGYWLYLFRKTRSVEVLKGFFGIMACMRDRFYA